MKRPASALRATAGKPGRLKGLAELKSVRITRPPPATPVIHGDPPNRKPVRIEAAAEFREAVRDVRPLAVGSPPAHRSARRESGQGEAGHPAQRERDNRAVLTESLGEAIDLETMLETDASLSYRRNGISA
ncbi:MAG TPA: hypothetical protein VH278_15880, partial [Burkholderiaceae bacterium]|nr:hypothetical protein [Burkholderiaceae bacterium]